MPPKKLARKGPPVAPMKKQNVVPQTLLQQQLQLNSLRAFRELQQQHKNSSSALLVSFALFSMSIALVFMDLLLNWLLSRNDMASYSNALRRADIMSEPIIKKITEQGENEYLSYACSCMQGWRRSMEDSHTNLLLPTGGFFGVYDGHSGAETAKFCGAHMYDFVSKSAPYSKNDFTAALHDGFIDIDKHLYNLPNHEKSGCTACVLHVTEDQLFCANAGDSRCVLCRNGEAFPLSNDHKPFLESEQSRIERAGGYIWNRRVNGILALSRAIGDFGFKKNSQLSWDQQCVTSAPEVRTTHLNRDKDEFVVLACDGIWDMRSNEQVVEFVRNRLQQHFSLGIICEQLMDSCLSPIPFGLGCDNMSVIIVQFKHRPASPNRVAAASTAFSRTSTEVTDIPESQSRRGYVVNSSNEDVSSLKRDSGDAYAHSAPCSVRNTFVAEEKREDTSEDEKDIKVVDTSQSTTPKSSFRQRSSSELSESQKSEMDELREFVSKSK